MKQEVYFKNIQSKISELLDTAEFEVKIAVAWFTDEYLIKKLKKLAKAGINVTIIIYEDRINKKDLFEELYNLNCKIYLSKKLMHNKFCIIDNDVVINGSYNWTYSAHSNSENITVTYSNLEFTKNFIEEFNKLSKKCNLINSYFKLNEHEENFLIYYNENKEKYEVPYFFKNISNDNINSIFLIQFESEHKRLLKSQYEGKLQKFNIYNSIERKYINQFLFVYELDFDANNIGVFKRDFYITEKSKNIQQNTVLENDLVLEKISNKGKVVESIDLFLKLENGYFLEKSRFRGNSADYPYYYHLYNNELKRIIFDLSSESIIFFKDKIICYKNKKLGVISNDGDKIEDFKYHRFEKNCLVLREFPFKVFSIRECKFYHYFENSLNSNYGQSYKDEYINIESKQKNYIKYYSKVDESKTNFIFIYNSEVERKIIDKKYLVLDYFSYLQSIYGYDKVNSLLEKENVDNIAYVQNMILKEYSSHVPKPYCYIATMAYEDINHPKVQNFRDFRDNYLSKTVLGNHFINYYYKYSLSWVKVLEPHKTINKVIRLCLDILNYFIPKSKF